MYIPRYLEAKSKIDKSVILGAIVDKVDSLIDPETGHRARFVKAARGGGGWFVISDELAREKVGHAMREAVAAIGMTNQK